MWKRLFLGFIFIQFSFSRSPFCGGSVVVDFIKRKDIVKLCIPDAKNTKTDEDKVLNKKTSINPYGLKVSFCARLPMNDYFLIGILGGMSFAPVNNIDEDMSEKIDIRRNVLSFYGGISIGVLSNPTNLTLVSGFVSKDGFKIISYERTDFKTFNINPIHFGVMLENYTAISKKIFFKFSIERIFRTSSSHNNIKIDTSGTNFCLGLELKM